MLTALPLVLVLPAAALLALASLPRSLVKTRPPVFRTLITLIAAMQFFVTICITSGLAAGWVGPLHIDLIRASSESPIAASVYFDEVAGLMLTLVSFIGWVICQYSIRYLDGEAEQGSYFRWISMTIGSVCFMVVAGNLLMFIVAWVMTSLGLHRLLLHYGHRPAARRGAWSKFVVSRIGDVSLAAAAALIYSQFKTLEFAELFALAGSLTSVEFEMQVAGFLLVLGAITKSAQFPFHAWLPQTMETPTPVSALMHAGIVNAGGFLMIRTSPLVSLTPWALTSLAIVGGVTACLAVLIMLTQTSVKKSLAYSTIAQMGFMLFQCGIGAYSAAMLHILAHSLYKAHAFLSSGSVINGRAATRSSLSGSQEVHWIKLTAVGLSLIGILWTSLTIFGINPMTKPGGLLLGGILCLAMTHWIAQVMRDGSHGLWVHAIAVVCGLCLVYSASFGAVDAFIEARLPVAGTQETFSLVAGLIVMSFFGLLILRTAVGRDRCVAVLNKWHIHASNGFYIENTMRRVFGPLLNT